MSKQSEKLNNEINDLQVKIADMRFDFKTGGNVNLGEFRKMKKELARMLTKRRAVELGLVVEEEAPAKKEVKKEKSDEKESKAKKSTKETK